MTNYMQFIQQRATGQLMTTAEWMRNFVTSHPDYKDSVVTQRIAYNLMERCHHIGIGTMTEPSLLPSFTRPSPWFRTIRILPIFLVTKSKRQIEHAALVCGSFIFSENEIVYRTRKSTHQVRNHRYCRTLN